MKKILAMLLAVVMLLAMSTTVFAEELESHDVKGTYVVGGTEQTVYSVDIAWGAMEFTYTDAFVGTWNAATHSYDGATEAKWIASGNTISVTNHSNAEVKVKLSFAAVDGLTTVTGSFDKAELTLPTAEGKALNAAELTGTATLTLSGSLTEAYKTQAKIGSVTVTLDN